jgi:hypothetical protein
MKTPTDLKILKLIYKTYYKTYISFSRNNKTRETKIYVPIDSDLIAKKLGVDGDIVFGRLYYYLNEKYSYVESDGVKVKFFTLSAGNDVRCIQFPLMASVLAGLRSENKKYLTATIIAFISLLLATLSIFIAIIKDC